MTELTIADEMGIQVGLTRHLRRTAIHDETVTFGHPKALHPLQRKMPKSTIQYYKTLVHEDDYICPFAHQITTRQHASIWYKLFGLVNHEVSVRSLCWPYWDTHEDEIEMEYAMAHLRWFAKKWLSTDQLMVLERKATAWEDLPPTIESYRNRRFKKA